MMLIRLLAVGYLLYCLYQMFKMYIAGGEDAPSLGLLIGATVLFVGGSAWVGIITWRQYKRLKEEQQARWEEEDRLEEEAKRLEEEREFEEDFEEISDEEFEEVSDEDFEEEETEE